MRAKTNIFLVVVDSWNSFHYEYTINTLPNLEKIVLFFISWNFYTKKNANMWQKKRIYNKQKNCMFMTKKFISPENFTQPLLVMLETFRRYCCIPCQLCRTLSLRKQCNIMHLSRHDFVKWPMYNKYIYLF